MDWYKHDIGAYRRATSRLKPLAHGVYRLLMDEYYSGQGPLPDDWSALYRIAGAQTEAEKATVRTVADQYFPKNGDGFRHNERCDEELDEYRARSLKNKANSQRRFDKPVDHRMDNRMDHPPAHPLDHTNKETNIQRNKDACMAYLQNGQKCGQPASSKLGAQWLCPEHHPYLSKQ